MLEDYRNSTEHIIARPARFHIEFEGIHPLKHNLCAMEKLFVGYVNARPDGYLMMLGK